MHGAKLPQANSTTHPSPRGRASSGQELHLLMRGGKDEGRDGGRNGVQGCCKTEDGGGGVERRCRFYLEDRRRCKAGPRGLSDLSPPPLCFLLFIHSSSRCQAAKEMKSRSGSPVICFAQFLIRLKKPNPCY